MGDTKDVEIDTKSSGSSVMRALADTNGMTTPQRAEFWLAGLAFEKHGGRHDTWTAARDKAARDAKVPLTLAKRIWQRWQDMNDVGGDALLKLMLAYEAMCERNEEAAAAYRQKRLSLRNQHAVDRKRPGEGVGMDSPEN